jgi:hypothetical protein
MDLVSWAAAAYILLLPSSYRLETQKVERIPFPGTTVETVETTCIWKDDQGQTVTFSWWKPVAAYPGGQMVAARQMPGSWAGAPASFVETKVFYGGYKRVSAAFQKMPSFGAHARIYASALELDALQGLLNAATVRDLTTDQASEAGCKAAHPS